MGGYSNRGIICSVDARVQSLVLSPNLVYMALSCSPENQKQIQNVFEEEELPADSVIKESFITAADGKCYQTK